MVCSAYLISDSVLFFGKAAGRRFPFGLMLLVSNVGLYNWVSRTLAVHAREMFLGGTPLFGCARPLNL